MSFARLTRLLACALLAVATACGGIWLAPAPAHAQGIDLFGFLRPPGNVPSAPQRARPQSPSWNPFFNFGAPPPAPVETPVRKPDPEGIVYESAEAAGKGKRQPPTKFVLVMGDRVAAQLAQGLADAYLGDRATTAIIGRTVDESGFQAAPVDWIAKVPDAIAASKPQATVVALGSDDLQPIRDGETMVEPLTERWLDLYTRRVDEVLTVLRERTGGRLIVVGLAPVGTAALSQDYARLNEVLRARAARAGVSFANVWDGFVDEEGKFLTFGPAVDGQRRRLRLSDGVRFTRAGARKLAFFVEKDLNRFLADPIPQSADDGDGANAAASAPARTLAGGPQANPPLAATPVAARGSSPVRTLRDGIPLDPVRGRADDFSWPPPTEAPAPAPASAAP